MFSEEERRSFLDMAQSAELREEFRQLRALAGLPKSEPVDVRQLCNFLTTMARLCPTPPPPRPFVPYSRVLL